MSQVLTKKNLIEHLVKENVMNKKDGKDLSVGQLMEIKKELDRIKRNHNGHYYKKRLIYKPQTQAATAKKYYLLNQSLQNPIRPNLKTRQNGRGYILDHFYKSSLNEKLKTKKFQKYNEVFVKNGMVYFPPYYAIRQRYKPFHIKGKPPSMALNRNGTFGNINENRSRNNIEQNMRNVRNQAIGGNVGKFNEYVEAYRGQPHLNNLTFPSAGNKKNKVRQLERTAREQLLEKRVKPLLYKKRMQNKMNEPHNENNNALLKNMKKLPTGVTNKILNKVFAP